MANDENLIPNSERSPTEVRENGRKGGVASGKARREKKLMLEAYGEYLAGKHKVKINGEDRELQGWEVVNLAIGEGMKKNPVAMVKELREGIDGNKSSVNLTSDIDWSQFTKEEILEMAKGKKDD